MDDTITAETWMLRATAFELLSLMFLLPSQETAEALTTGDFSASCSEVIDALELGVTQGGALEIPGLRDAYVRSHPEEVYHELRREYTRLLVGERKPLVTPYVGVWAAQQRGQKGLLFVGKESLAIERVMRRCGVVKNLAAGQSNDPMDHVGTVCEFLKYLCLVNAKAVQAPEGARIESGEFESFLTEHFLAYALWCSDQVADLARCPFYKAAAILLKSTCEHSAAKTSS